MGCASSISPFPENKMNKYAIESPRKEDAEEMPETAQNMDNNSDSMPVPMSPVIVRKVQTNEVKDEDVVRGFEEDPAEDDSKIEQNVKAKTKADKFLAGSDGTRAGSSPATIKVETAEEWLRNRGEKHAMNMKNSENRSGAMGIRSTPHKSTIYSPPGGTSLKMTAWE